MQLFASFHVHYQRHKEDVNIAIWTMIKHRIFRLTLLLLLEQSVSPVLAEHGRQKFELAWYRRWRNVFHRGMVSCLFTISLKTKEIEILYYLAIKRTLRTIYPEQWGQLAVCYPNKELSPIGRTSLSWGSHFIGFSSGPIKPCSAICSARSLQFCVTRDTWPMVT